MVDFDEIFPFIVALIVGAVLFMSIISLVKKSINPTQSRQYKIDSHSELQDQKWRMNDVRQRQKQLLRDQQQKIRDLQRR